MGILWENTELNLKAIIHKYIFFGHLRSHNYWLNTNSQLIGENSGATLKKLRRPELIIIIINQRNKNYILLFYFIHFWGFQNSSILKSTWKSGHNPFLHNVMNIWWRLHDKDVLESRKIWHTDENVIKTNLFTRISENG